MRKLLVGMLGMVMLAGFASAATMTPKATESAQPVAASVQRTQDDDGPKTICWYYDVWGRLHYYQCRW